jgi:hypothetical protein
MLGSFVIPPLLAEQHGKLGARIRRSLNITLALPAQHHYSDHPVASHQLPGAPTATRVNGCASRAALAAPLLFCHWDLSPSNNFWARY